MSTAESPSPNLLTKAARAATDSGTDGNTKQFTSHHKDHENSYSNLRPQKIQVCYKACREGNQRMYRGLGIIGERKP